MLLEEYGWCIKGRFRGLCYVVTQWPATYSIYIYFLLWWKHMFFFVLFKLSSLKVTDYLHTMTAGQDKGCVYFAPLITWTLSNVYFYKPKEETPGPRETKLKKRLVDVNPRRPRMYIDIFWRFLSKEKRVPHRHPKWRTLAQNLRQDLCASGAMPSTSCAYGRARTVQLGGQWVTQLRWHR